ncbi:MAG: hypothetical protein QXH24_04420 [Candidatus Bathyarchaeia archaeon]
MSKLAPLGQIGRILNEFFKAVLNKKFGDAERILQEIVERVGADSEFKRGFMQGLKGILNMYRLNDQYTFLNTLNLTDVNTLREYYDDFLENLKKRLRTDYDRGYFLALAKYLYFCLKNIETRIKET